MRPPKMCLPCGTAASPSPFSAFSPVRRSGMRSETQTLLRSRAATRRTQLFHSASLLLP